MKVKLNVGHIVFCLLGKKTKSTASARGSLVTEFIRIGICDKDDDEWLVGKLNI